MEDGKTTRAISAHLAGMPAWMRRSAIDAAIATLQDAERAVVDAGGDRRILVEMFEELYRMRDEITADPREPAAKRKKRQ